MKHEINMGKICLLSLAFLLIYANSALAVPVDWWGVLTIDDNSSSTYTNSAIVEAFINNGTTSNVSDVSGTPDSGYYLIHVPCIANQNVSFKINGVNVFEAMQTCPAAGTSRELNLSMNKTGNGANCTNNGGCVSGNCDYDYDGSGAWCAEATRCAHNNETSASGAAVCSSSTTLQTCSSGNWTATTCANGCSAGVCTSAAEAANTGGSAASETGADAVTEKTPEYNPVISLETNQKLQKTIISLIMGKGITQEIINKVIENSKTITSSTTAKSKIAIGSSATTVTHTFTYSGEKKVNNFVVYEKIPQTFAESTDYITINAPDAKSIIVVEKDPEYAIAYSEVIPGQEISISYSVNTVLTSGILDDFKTELYGEEFIEDEAEEPEEPPVTPPVVVDTGTPEEVANIILGVMVVVIIVIVIITGFVFYEKKMKKDSARSKKYKYQWKK